MTTWETAREECHQAYIEPTMTRMGIQGYELKVCYRTHPESDYYTLIFQRPFQWREDVNLFAAQEAICGTAVGQPPFRTIIGDPPAEQGSTAP